MSDDSYSFSTARARLDEIVTQVRKKDTSLEKSLDLLEEGVRLANACTELIDHADWTVGGADVVAAESVEASEQADDNEPPSASVTDGSESAAHGPAEDPVAGSEGDSEDAEFAPDDDAFGDAADEAWADGAPEYRDDEA